MLLNCERRQKCRIPAFPGKNTTKRCQHAAQIDINLTSNALSIRPRPHFPRRSPIKRNGENYQQLSLTCAYLQSSVLFLLSKQPPSPPPATFIAPVKDENVSLEISAKRWNLVLSSPRRSELCIALNNLALSCRFSKDLSTRTGKQVKSRWRLCWKFISPLIIFSVIVGGIVQMIISGEFKYTAWDRNEVLIRLHVILCYITSRDMMWCDTDPLNARQ